MAIADKVTSITNHLIADYEELENIGAELENVDKNIENIASCLEEVYNNIPKTTGEDTNLSLNTIKGKMNIIPKGDTQQTQYSGKNVLQCRTDISIGQTGSSNGITWKRTGENTWTFNGTCTSDFTLIIGTNTSLLANLTTGETYTLSGCPSGGSDSTYRLQVYHYNTTGTAVDRGSGLTFVADIQNESNVAVRIVNGTTANNLTFNTQIEKGSSKTSFEPYVGGTASPNPTYPQNIEVATGTQEVKVSGNEFAEIETQTLNDMKITKTDNGYILNGTARANTTFRATITNATNTNKTICAKCDTTITNANVQIKTRNSSASQLRSISLGNANTWVVDSGTYEDYYCDIYVKSGTTLSNVLVQPMLLEGTFTTSNLGKYQPYNEEQTQTISLGNIELCKIGNYQDYLYKSSGKNLFNKEDSSIIFNGFPNASTNTLQTNNNARTICLPCKPNTTYTISKVLSQRFLRAETSSDTIQANIEVSNIYGNASLTEQHITTGANAKYILIFYYLSTADTLSEETIRNSIMINYGSTALPYEPYGSGKWYKKENINKHIFTENENISLQSINSYGIANFFISHSLGSVSALALCNYFTLQTSGISVTQEEGFLWQHNGVYFRIKSSTASDVSSFKTWLNSHNVEVYYILATPNDIEITNETLIEQLDNLEKMYSYNGITNISSSGNLSAILGVSALKGE